MKATTITPNLIQLTKFGMMNAYLVREDDGFTLIDTTMNAAGEIIAEAAAAGAKIKRIALTHGHSDHTGSVDALRAQLGSEVPLLMTEIDARILAGETVDFGADGKKRGGWPKVETKPDTFLSPGDHVSSLQVFDSAGHTPGHISFLDTRDGSLIAGDAFSSIGGLSVPNSLHWRFPLPYLATCNRPLAEQAAETLRVLKPNVLVVGHGRATKNPHDAMEAAISAARRS